MGNQTHNGIILKGTREHFISSWKSLPYKNVSGEGGHYLNCYMKQRSNSLITWLCGHGHEYNINTMWIIFWKSFFHFIIQVILHIWSKSTWIWSMMTPGNTVVNNWILPVAGKLVNPIIGMTHKLCNLFRGWVEWCILWLQHPLPVWI